MNDIIENGHGQTQASQLDAGGGVSAAAGSVPQPNDLLDQFSAPDLEHSNLNQVNLNLNDLNDSTINLNNSNGSLDLGSININFPLSGADSSIKTAPSPKKTSSKKRKLDELAFENISDSESAGSSSSKESKTKEIKYGAEFSFGGSEPAGNQDFLDAAASTILADAEPKSHDENEPAPDANNPNSNEQVYQQQQQPMSNRQPTPNRVASPAFNHQLQSPYMMQQNGAAQIQSPGCQQQQQQPVPSPMSQSHQAIQSPMQAKPPTPHANQHAAAPSPAHYHRSQLDEANFQGVPPHHVQQQQQQPPPPPPHPQPTFIHVFTTQIANDAAQSVARQQNRSIIEFHRNMPATIDFMRTFHHHQSMRPNGVPLPVPNEHLTLEQLKTRTEKLGKLKNLSSIIGIGGQMEPGAKRARSSNPPGQVPGSGAPSPFTNGTDCYPMDQFNPMMPNYEPYRMGSPQQQQQQGPPPPYALKPKMHKAAPPEKYTDKMKSGQSPCMPPNIDNVNTGLQTTPSPQLMNYFELEGQELTITKQLNHSFKSNGPDDDNKTLARPPSAQNSNIINCLNGSVNQSGNDESDKHKQQQQQQQQQDLEQYAGNEGEQSRKTPGINKSLSNSQLDYYQGGVNSPHNSNNNSNNQSSPAMNGASGPLNQMLQMTNSIPKASPYSNAKSPGPNHPQFGGPAHQPQMSSSPSPIMQQGPPGQPHQGPPPPHMLMQQPQAMPPGIKNGKMSKKHQQQQQQQQQEMMQRGMMMDGMGPPPPHGMHRGPLPPPHMLPPHMINHPGMGDPRLMAPRFPNGPTFRPMRDPDMFQNGGGGPPPPHNSDYPPAEYAKPSHRSKSRQQPQNDMPMPMPNGMMMNAPPPHPPNMMPMMPNNGKYPPHEQQMYPPPHHNEFANGPPRPMHPMHMGPRPPIDPAMLPPGIMPNGMPPGMMRPMHPNQQQQGPPPFDMPPPPPHHLHHYSQPQSQNAQQNFDNPNNSNSNSNNNNNNYNSADQQQQQNQVLPQMLQNSANQQSQQQQQQQHHQQQQQQQSQQELNSLQQQMGLGPGPGGDNLAFPDLSDPILQFGD